MALVYSGSSSATITSPGDYTIDQDLTQSNPSAHCVTINPGVHYVTIRLRSRLVGAGGTGSTNAGIYLNGNAAVTIIGDGGSIRGFGYGIKTDSAYLTRINDIFIQDALFRGIRTEGDDTCICNCDIREVHGATWTPAAYCMGIESSGVSLSGGMSKILRNSVQNVHGTTSGGNTGESVGISITDYNANSVVQGNLIQNDTKPGLPFGGGASIGVWIGGQSSTIVAHNTIRTWDQGLISSTPPSMAHGQNLFVNCTVNAMTGGATIPSSED